MDKTINANRLFWASCVALIVTAMTFGIRSGMLGTWGTEFGIDTVDLGIIASTAFWGFTLAMVFGGPLCDVIGMKRLAIMAFTCHLIGILLTVFSGGFWSLFISTLICGIGNGLVEAACNPLITSLYPTHKTEKLNLFHLWYPGGVVIGTLIGYLLQEYYDPNSWKAQMLTMLVPTAIYGFMFLGQKFPVTERVASGVSTQAMFKACLNPLFLFMMICMFITASTEFGVNNWVPLFLRQGEISSLLLLMWVSLIMALSRAFLGPFVHKAIPSERVLLISGILCAIGIYWLSYATGVSAFVAAVIFGAGVSFFWPTMLGFVSENLPRTGALGLSIMGGAGMLAAAFALPILGGLYDDNVAKAVTSGASADSASIIGGADTLRTVIVLPVFLIVAFTGLVIYKRKNPTIQTLHSA